MSIQLRTTKTAAKSAGELRQLRELARLYGIATHYIDTEGRRRRPTPEGLLAITSALGVALDGMKNISTALDERRYVLWQQPMDPVAVAWEGKSPKIGVRVAAAKANSGVACELVLETGEVRSWRCDLHALQTTETAVVCGREFVVKQVPVQGQLPLGYHRLTVELRGQSAEALIISAPVRAFQAASSHVPERRKTWGVFLPLYALHSERSWGSGDFTDLETFLRWTSELGGAAVATLPLLAAFLDDKPFDPSPYNPVSRFFWNEFYVDITRVPELRHCAPAQALLGYAEIRSELAELRKARLVDYRRGMALKRRILEELARYFFDSVATGPKSAAARNVEESQEDRVTQFQRFLAAHPMVEDYARFRAACEQQCSPWPVWPERQRDGKLAKGDYDEQARRYHLYAQWIAHEQLESISREARQKDSGLCLDLPLGFHPEGYDVWHWRDTFVRGISAGAPPDTFFTKGQVWSFPPLHPETLRRQGYEYFIGCLRHQLKHASILRIDHVMGFHRLFWIPDGLEPKDGAYVRYRAEEFYAICCLESHRHGSWIVGENLGTVPPYVNPALARHNIKGMYVMQYELAPRRKLPAVPSNCVASLNTHDTPLFAGFWQGLDIEDLRELGLVSPESANQRHEIREAQKKALVSSLRAGACLENSTMSARAVFQASLDFLSSSSAHFVQVNLEDLWLEAAPQNVPGTGHERPNWRRKAVYTFEQFSKMPGVLKALGKVNKYRHRNGSIRIKKRELISNEQS